MGGIALDEEVVEVLVELHVAALVGGHRDGMGVFLDGGVHDVDPAAVVTEMDHLRPRRLQDASEDVDRGVVTVEQGGGGDETNLVGQLESLVGSVTHGGSKGGTSHTVPPI